MKSYRSSSGLLTIGFGCLLIFFSGCGGSESLDEQVSKNQLEEEQENSSQDQSANEQGSGGNDLLQEEGFTQDNQELEAMQVNNEEAGDDLAMEDGQEFENLQENENDFQGEDQEAQNDNEQQDYQNQQDDNQQYANDYQQDFNQNQQDFDQDQQEFADDTDNMQAVEQQQVVVETAGITEGYVVRGQAGTAAGDGLPEYGSKMPYFVKPGETLSKIATKIFGKAEYWRDISELTGLEDPNLIYPGQVVYYQLLEESVSFARADTAVGTDKQQQVEVVVEKGQSLWSIAEEVYGQGVYWKNIWKQNQEIKDPDNIKIGTKISLKVYETNSQELVAKSQIKPHVEKHVKQVLQHRA